MILLLEKILKLLIILLLALICIVVGAQVFFRFVLSNPLPWPEELGRLLFIFLAFIGAGLTSLHNDHIAVEVIDQKVFRGKTIIVLFRHCAIALVSLFIIIGGFQIYPKAARIKLSATGLPKSLMTLAVIIGAIIMMIAAMIHIFSILSKLKEN